MRGRRLITDYRAGNVKKADQGEKAAEKTHRKLLPPLPKKYDSAIVILLKLGFTAYLATVPGGVSFGPTGKISGAIWCLILGVLFTAVGFLETGALTKANSFGIAMFALMMYIFDGLKDCTPEMLSAIAVPLVGLIVVGVSGMLIFSVLAAKLVRLSVPLAISVSLTALYGFPPTPF